MQSLQFLTVFCLLGGIPYRHDQFIGETLAVHHRCHIQLVIPVINQHDGGTVAASGKGGGQWAQFTANDIRVAHGLIEVQTNGLLAAKPFLDFAIGRNDIVVPIQQGNGIGHLVENGGQSKTLGNLPVGVGFVEQDPVDALGCQKMQRLRRTLDLDQFE